MYIYVIPNKINKNLLNFLQSSSLKKKLISSLDHNKTISTFTIHQRVQVDLHLCHMSLWVLLQESVVSLRDLVYSLLSSMEVKPSLSHTISCNLLWHSRIPHKLMQRTSSIESPCDVNRLRILPLFRVNKKQKQIS